jgi:hypothetical protein
VVFIQAGGLVWRVKLGKREEGAKGGRGERVKGRRAEEGRRAEWPNGRKGLDFPFQEMALLVNLLTS